MDEAPTQTSRIGRRCPRLVVITRDLEEDFVRRLFQAFTDNPQVDMPDRQALENNPLAIPGFKP